MKPVVYRFIFVLAGTLLITSCSNDLSAPFSFYPDHSASAPPIKDIYVMEGDLNSPYTLLGPVEYTLTSNFPLFSDQTSLRNQAIENLKQVAVARYGAGVDAIINIEFQENPEQGGYFSPATIYVKGIAVAYKEGTKPYTKAKKRHKVKASKNNSVKAKPSNSPSRKATPQEEAEPDISPSELLK